MHLSEGFVVGGRYRIERLVASGSKFRVYAASSGEHGPGEVAIKVARHDDVTSLAGLEVGRARVEAEWNALMRLHEHASSAAPLPLELVRMYPGDPEVRRTALLDKRLVRQEPYLVCEFADGLPLSVRLQGELLDEERALLIALRVVLLVRAARGVGIELDDFAPSNFVVDDAGENVSLVGLTGGGESGSSPGSPGAHVPIGFGRLIASLLAGMVAPSWDNEADDLPRWERLLESRRVPREFHDLVLGCVGYWERFDATLDGVENRLRALVRAPRARVYDHPGRSQDSAYLIANGERIASRFEILKPLGQGGRGFVYRVRDEISKAEVLVKCNKYVYDSGSAFALELPTRRLELEHEFDVLKHFASKTGMLPQPVALVRGRGRGAWFDLAPDLAGDEPFVVMEYIKGIPLLDLLPRPYDGYSGANDPANRLDPRFVLRLVAQLADVLSRFHADGFLYQDLKPENVLYDPKAENVYMVDFAGACPRDASGHLQKGHVAFGVQTHGFAAPEFAQLWERSDARFDIYSLGATAYHLLTGINPERVALEEGTEYPTLSRGPLQTLPPAVAMLVDKCLAPLEQRLPSAAAVKKLAESARLQLSRSRPLDVRKPRVAYTEHGVAIHWALPEDPRVASLRIHRQTNDVDDIVVYEGAPTSSHVDTEPSAADSRYVVETAYERNGRVKHSRGRVVRAEAHPAPVLFEVSPYFGGNRIRCALAPHASELIVRWSDKAAPLDVNEGTLLEIPLGERFLHTIPAGVTAHYAAFAAYGETISAPRSGSATALAALPNPGQLAVSQASGSVSVAWERAVDGLCIAAVVDGEPPRLLRPDEGASSVTDDGVERDTRIEYRAFVVRAGVTSDPVAWVRVHTWPTLPPFDVTPGVESALIDLGGPLHERVREVEARVLVDGEETHSVRLEVAGFPARVPIPPDVDAMILLRGLVDDSGLGPGVMGRVTVPPSDAEIRLVDDDGLLPIALEASLPAEAARWSGVYTLEVSRDGDPIETVEGHIAVLFVSRKHELVFRLEDDGVEPGQEVEYGVRLTGPADDTIALSSAKLRGLERLSAPLCKPELGAVVVEPIPGVERVDIALTRAGGSEEFSRVVLPFRLELAPGERVEVAVRRTVSGGPMPWSPPTDIEALQRPPTPSDIGVSTSAGVVTLAWSPLQLAGVEYVVRDESDGTTLYVGPFASFADESGRGAKTYSVESLRNGLRSDAARVAVPDPLPARTRSALVPLGGSARRVRGLLPSDDGLVQCVRVGRLGVVEVAGPARRRLIVVIEGDDEAALDATVGTLHDPDWLRHAEVSAAVIGTGRRVLVPWRGGRSAVRVVEAALELDRPEWRMVAPKVEPVRGHAVGVLSTQSQRLQLWCPTGPLAVSSDADALIVYRDDDRVSRAKLQTAAAKPVTAITREGVEVWLAANASNAAGIGLELSQSGAVLVPAPSNLDDGALPIQLWADAARGLPLLVAQRLESLWRAPIASQHLGNPAVFHYLKDGSHVELTIGCEVVAASGSARLYVGVASLAGRREKLFRLPLARPRAYGRVVARVASWAERRLRRPDEASDDLALIA